MTSQEFFDSLSNWELIQYYQDSIRHNHYCPCECHCFDKWEHFNANVSDVETELLKRMGSLR